MNQQRTGVFKKSWTSSHFISAGYSFNICVFCWGSEVWYRKLCFSWDFDCISLEFYGWLRPQEWQFLSWRCEFLGFLLNPQAKFTTWKPVNMKYLLYLKTFSRREGVLLILNVERAETSPVLKFWICLIVCLAMQWLCFMVRSILCTQSILEQTTAELWDGTNNFFKEMHLKSLSAKYFSTSSSAHRLPLFLHVK